MSAPLNPVAAVNDRYAAAASVAGARGAVELVVVHDTAGADFNSTVRELRGAEDLQLLTLWEELLPAAGYLRRLRATEPFPASFSARHHEAVGELRERVAQGRALVGAETAELLGRLVDQAATLEDGSPTPVGELLLESLAEIGPENCVVLAANARAEHGLRAWLGEVGIEAAAIAVTGRAGVHPDSRAYLLGPPGFLGARSFLAPACPELSYLFPAWAPDRSLPTTLLSEHAVGGIYPTVRVAHVGTPTARNHMSDTTSSPAPETGPDDLEELLSWSDPAPPAREPLPDEVLARRVLLAGGRSMLLDQDGGWIRALDPEQPAGERVHQRDEQTVVPGVYLVLREGVTNSQSLYDRTMTVLGGDAEAVEAKQSEWKAALARTLRVLGNRQVVRQLERAGVGAAARAPAWVEQTLARPQDPGDFEKLLRWLRMSPVRSYVANADKFAKARYRAANDVRELLEEALDAADLEALHANGIVRLRVKGEQFASIMAARVIAVSPDKTLVPRASVRVPQIDRRARWLE